MLTGFVEDEVKRLIRRISALEQRVEALEQRGAPVTLAVAGWPATGTRCPELVPMCYDTGTGDTTT